jgi:hypothetical protein
MGGQKKKLIEELEMEVKECIAKSGQSKDDILNNCNDYHAPKKDDQ